MDESMAETASGDAGPRDLPQWKAGLSLAAGALLALVFLVAGVWKITDPIAAAVRMAQAQVPQVLSLPAALAFGISETFAGVLLLVPRYRRWGAWLAGLLLLGFIAYIGLFYNVLRGEECNCFPWVKRAVGPAFFIGDAIMLLMALAAGWWARPSRGLRNAALMLGAVCVFSLVSYGVTAARRTGVRAPDYVTVDGKPFSLHQGRVFVFFFNPMCLHCDHAARELAKLDWGKTAIVVVSTQMPERGPEFLSSTQLRGVLTPDVDELRKIFSFVDVPFAVALENGRQRAAFTGFEGNEPALTLRKLGFVK
jgi:uncharacterized membrane protein YphA (DoxX/SURF4 family)